MSPVELRQLAYFVGVAEEQSFSRAAERLRVAQSALSRQIRDLERELGVELLVRVASGAEPTAAGRVLLAGAQRTLARGAAALHRTRMAALGLAGELHVGVGRATLGRETVRRALSGLRTHLPDVHLHADEVEAGPPQWEQLRQRTIDIAIGLEAPAGLDDIAREAFLDSSLDAALVPAGHPLARRPTADARGLSELALLWVPRAVHPDLTDELLAQLARLGIGSPVQDEHLGAHALRMEVALGRGWTPVPTWMGEWPPEGTAVVAVPGLHVPLRDVLMCRRDDARPVVRRAMDLLQAVARGQPLPVPTPGEQRVRSATGFTLRQLRTFVAVGTAQSAPAAAASLGITPSALSRQLRDLETAVAIALFERPRLAHLTTAGSALLEEAVPLLQDVDQMVAETVRAHRLRMGRCVVSGVELVHANPMVQHILRRWAERQPELQIVLEELPTGEQVHALLSARIDLAFCRRGGGGAYTAEIDRLLLSEHLLDAALLPSGHPLATRRSLRIDELAGLPFLFVEREAEPGLYDQIMDGIERAGGALPTLIAVGSFQAARAFVATGRGWTLGTRRDRRNATDALVAVPLGGIAIPSGRELLSRHNEPNERVRAILALAREVVEERRPQPDRAGPRHRSG